MRSRWSLVALGVFLLAGCAPRVTLTDTLSLHQAGHYRDVLAACEDELSRWRAADAAVAAEEAAALTVLDQAFADELVLSPIEDGFGAAAAREALATEALTAGGGGGGALRLLAEDLLSDAPLRIVRAAHDAAELGLSRLAPHLIAALYAQKPLDGVPGPLRAFPVGVRMLATKSYVVRSLRRLLVP